MRDQVWSQFARLALVCGTGMVSFARSLATQEGSAGTRDAMMYGGSGCFAFMTFMALVGLDKEHHTW